MADGLQASGLDVTLAGRPVLRGIDVAVPAGRVTVLSAPSGAGKSTLLRALVGLVPATAGVVSLDGEDVSGLDPRELRRLVGLVAQVPAMLPGTVAVNLRHGLEPGSDIDAALAAAGLEPAFAARTAAELSGGERARVALARALTRGPRVLLLDEPTAALDDAAAEHLGRTLRGLAADGLGLLVATHDTAWAARFADVRTALSSAPATLTPP